MSLPSQPDNGSTSDLRIPVPAPTNWPAPPAEAAYHGLAGEIVRAIEPHTEADPVALLVQLHVYFGSIIGHNPHFVVEDTRHSLNEYAVLVGETAKARKGTSGKRIERLFSRFDPLWADHQIVRGLSSGEGVIDRIRDAEASGEPTAAERDKRLLALDGEFASTLKMLERHGNTLSPVLRTAWDGDPLSVLTKNNPMVATRPHISMVGHVTRSEVLRHLDRTEMANGFANRFLWVAVRRWWLMPEGGSVPASVLEPLSARLGECIHWAQSVQEIARDPAMRLRWREAYLALSEPISGLVGSLLARAEAHVMRLTAIYALLDRSVVMRREHLEAALALWAYVDRSARYIFGEALGDPLADEILEALRQQPDGLSRTQLRDLFARHTRRTQMDASLRTLRERGLARMEMLPTEGRPEERWHATEPPGQQRPLGGVANHG